MQSEIGYGLRKGVVALLFLLACLPVFSQPQPEPEREACRRLDSLFQEMVRKKHFNGVMLVGDAEHVIYQRVSGLAYLNGRQRLHDRSQFEIASVSKQFTAVSVLMLYEQGLLDLQDSLQRFFPNFPYKGITVWQLLCHRSGLPEYFDFALDYWPDEKRPMDNADLLGILERFHPDPESNPDTKFSYCNTGYALLALLVERVSGMPFRDFLLRNIFEPLEMNDTRCYTEPCQIASLRTTGHRRNKSVYERDALSGVLGDKGVMTTANDLYRWFFHIPCLIADSTLQKAWTAQHMDEDTCRNYGLGWRLSCDEQGRKLVYHGGLWNGNHTLMLYRPADQTFLLFLSNWCNGAFQHRSNSVLKIMDAMQAKKINTANVK